VEKPRVTGRRREESEEAVKEYWTDERMAAAQPVKSPEPANLPEQDPREPPAGESEARSSPPQRPEPGPGAEVGTEAQKVSDPTAWPYISCGKLWFTRDGGATCLPAKTSRRCLARLGSAGAIESHVLVTARRREGRRYRSVCRPWSSEAPRFRRWRAIYNGRSGAICALTARRSE
jgi:hypothetical protein